MIGEVLRHPRLDANELEVIRRQVITSLEQATTDPSSLGKRSVDKRLSPYPKGHPLYVMSVDEEIDMYRNVRVEEISDLHAELLSNQAGEVTAVGDFDAEELKAMFTKVLCGLGNVGALRAN